MSSTASKQRKTIRKAGTSGSDAFTRSKHNLQERARVLGEELAGAQDELETLTIAAEQDPAAHVQALAVAEQRCDRLHAEQARLAATIAGMDDRIAEARELEDRERRQAAGREYIAARDEQDVIAAGIVEKMEAVAVDVARITELAAVAHKVRRNAFGAAGAYVDTGPSLSWIGGYAASAADRNERRGRHRMDEYAAEARRPWRPARGPLAAALAELGL